MSPTYLIMPATGIDISDPAQWPLSQAVVSTSPVVSGLSNSTSYFAVSASAPSAAFTPALPATPVEETHVFILAGQSNMVGQGLADAGADYPEGTLQWDGSALIAAAEPLAHFSTGGGTSLAIEFCRDYGAAHPGVTIVLVPCASNGTGFSDGAWVPGGSWYTQAVNRINALFAAQPDYLLKGFLWHQGERDAADGTTAAAYQSALLTMLAGMRDAITPMLDTTPVVVGTLPAISTITYDYHEIQGALRAFPDSRAWCALADADRPVPLARMKDGLHWDAWSLREVGHRYYSAFERAVLAAPGVAMRVEGLRALAVDGGLSLSWEAPHDHGSAITGYLVEINSGAGWSTAASPTQTSVALSGLSNGTSYSLRVSAINASGTGAASVVLSATPGVPAQTAHAGAQRHWLLGSDNGSDRDLVAGAVLGRAQELSISRAAGYMSLPGREGYGLAADVLESADVTLCAVMRRSSGSYNVVLGQFTGYAGGWGITSNDRAFRPNSGYGTLAQQDTLGSWYFYAMSLSSAGNLRAYCSNSGSYETTLADRALTASPLPLVVGPGLYDALGTEAFNGAIDVAEVIVFDQALDLSEMAAVQTASATRLSARGVVLA